MPAKIKKAKYAYNVSDLDTKNLNILKKRLSRITDVGQVNLINDQLMIDYHGEWPGKCWQKTAEALGLTLCSAFSKEAGI